MRAAPLQDEELHAGAAGRRTSRSDAALTGSLSGEDERAARQISTAAKRIVGRSLSVWPGTINLRGDSEMSDGSHAVHAHHPPTSFIRKYIFSLDHKVIGIQYITLALAAVLVGMTMSVLMRMNLSWPGTHWPILGTLFPTGAPGGVMNPEFYLSLVTMHGTIMVFFVLTTAPQGGFGNYFLPIQIGAEDMAFPVLNMMSFWVTFVGFLVILLAIFVEGNHALGEAFASIGPSFTGGSGKVRPIGGWTGYAPLSALGKIAGPGHGAGMNL